MSNIYENNANKSISEVNKKEQWIERYWNKSRLLSIVSYGMRLRFQKAEMLYKESLYTTNYKNISKMAGMMVRGYEALVKEAEELGCSKLSVTMWPHEHKKTRYMIVKNDEEFWLAHNAYAEEPDCIVICLSELFKMADDDLLKTKKMIQETTGQPGKIIDYKKND